MRRVKRPLRIRAKRMRQKRRKDWFEKNIATAEEVEAFFGVAGFVGCIFAYYILFAIVLP